MTRAAAEVLAVPRLRGLGLTLSAFTLSAFTLLALLVLMGSTSVTASAQLPDNNYDLDMYIGTVVGDGRTVSMGGANAAIAEGLAGAPWSPASLAARSFNETEDIVYDFTLGAMLGGLVADNDFWNNGDDGSEVARSVFVDLGFRVQFLDLGLGVVAQSRQFSVATENGEVDVGFLTIYVGAAYAWDKGDVVFGMGVRIMSFGLAQGLNTLFNDVGLAPEAGLIWRPDHLPIRVGLTTKLSARIDLRDLDAYVGPGVAAVEGFTLPRATIFPWEVTLGFAYQFGRRFNFHRYDEAYLELGADEGEEVLPGMPEFDPTRSEFRSYTTLSLELSLVGDVKGAYGLDAFLTQQARTRGANTSVMARLGVETEVIANLLKLRGGIYVEPSRYEDVDYRPHFTAGADLRLFRWNVFGFFDEPRYFHLRGTLDIAARYIDWGVSVGIWY